MKKSVLVLAAVILLVAGGSAEAAHLITSSDIQNGTIRGRDIHKGTISMSRLTHGVRQAISSKPRVGNGPAGPKGPAGPAGPKGDKGDKGDRGPQGSQFNYEVDDGTNWALSNMPLALKNTGKGYEDAGIVVDLGPASSFQQITKTGSDTLVDNIWITDGGSAFSPGMHLLSDPVNFSYGLDQGNGSSFQMSSGPHSGQTLSAADIQADFGGYEAYAWVGVTSDGVQTVNGHISSVNGTPVGADVTLNGTTAAVKNG